VKAAKNYWFCILIGEDDQKFDVWIVDLEPDHGAL